MNEPPVPRATLEQIAAMMRALGVQWSEVAWRCNVMRLGGLTQKQSQLLLASLDAETRLRERRVVHERR